MQKVLRCTDNLNPNAWRKIYKTCLFDNIYFPKGKIYEDLATIPLLIDRVDKVAFCDRVDYFYTIRNNSITNSKLNASSMQIFGIIDDLQTHFKDRKDIIKALNYHAILVIIGFVLRFDTIDDDIFATLKRVLKSKALSVLIDTKVEIRHRVIAFVMVAFGIKTYKFLRRCYRLIK
ncbi:hypothetical protein [Campylobacter majalis]|uniref:hypothetical protein n=1 Tax=Campylobacter majalis TaxID=2790656 RepID=UPI003D694095